MAAADGASVEAVVVVAAVEKAAEDEIVAIAVGVAAVVADAGRSPQLR